MRTLSGASGINSGVTGVYGRGSGASGNDNSSNEITNLSGSRIGNGSTVVGATSGSSLSSVYGSASRTTNVISSTYGTGGTGGTTGVTYGSGSGASYGATGNSYGISGSNSSQSGSSSMQQSSTSGLNSSYQILGRGSPSGSRVGGTGESTGYTIQTKKYWKLWFDINNLSLKSIIISKRTNSLV